MPKKPKIELTDDHKKQLLNDFAKAMALFGEDFAVWLVVSIPQLYRDFSALVEMAEEHTKQTNDKGY